jgi:hypothetical protein
MQEAISAPTPQIDHRHPCFGAFGRKYYPAYFGEDRRDISFVSGRVRFDATLGSNLLDFYGFPAQVTSPADCSEKEMERAFDTLDKLSISAAKISDPLSLGKTSQLGAACLRRGFLPKVRLEAQCDLLLSPDEIHRHLRKSFRSLINWGRRNIDLSFVNIENKDRSACDEFQEFHKKVAGRVTRSQETWDIMFESCFEGRGELVLGRLKTGELVAGSLIVDGTEISHYATGVYDRERFDKPMGHLNIYESILRSRQRGMKTFDLGVVPLEDATPKEIDIGYFKRGFATHLATQTVWTKIDLKRDAAA